MTTRLPLIGGIGAGVAVALGFLLVPAGPLEAATEASGIAAVLPVAAPPLGVTARAVLALGGGLFVAAIGWAALYLLFGPGGPLARSASKGDKPSVRRGDAHPDAPPRWPLSAADLPVPPPPVEVAAELPKNLDTPLAAFDPQAVLPVPRAPVRALKPLAPALAPGERLETFTLTPPPPPPAPTPARSDEPPSIDALLRRLEQGASRKVATAR